MAKRFHKLAALRLLGEELGSVEAQRLARIDSGEDAGIADREAAQLALNAVLTFFQDYDIEAGSLVRLLSELAALSAGSRPSRMLRQAAIAHRRADAPKVELIKGRLAAIMEIRQNAGLTRKAAGEWVVRNAPERMRRELGFGSPSTVDSWLAKWGGKHGKRSDGRDSYLQMKAILKGRNVTEPELKRMMRALTRALPA